ncbi:MAG: RNA-binding protein [candidate division Zixibacteria bacterium]|nr:RNA-binding protein [candidate division Zixibacteria bacterium]
MSGSRLYVGNLSYSVTADQLKDLFGQYGEVVNVNVIEGKGFGFVEMATGDQASAAKEALNGSDYNGRTMRVDEARPPKARDDRGGGGGGDRGRRGGGGGPSRRF